MNTIPRRRSFAAFTLLEIMLVVMIIALLAGAAIHLMSKNVGIAKDVRARADIQNIMTQLRMYDTLNGGYPSTAQGLAALVQRPAGEPQARQWKQLLDEVPVDPWGHPYQFRNPATKSKDKVDLFSMGDDGIADTEDDIGNWQN